MHKLWGKSEILEILEFADTEIGMKNFSHLIILTYISWEILISATWLGVIFGAQQPYHIKKFGFGH